MLQDTQAPKLTHHKIKPLTAPYQGSFLLLWKRDRGDDQKLSSDHALSSHIVSHMVCSLYDHLSVLDPTLQQKIKGGGVA